MIITICQQKSVSQREIACTSGLRTLKGKRAITVFGTGVSRIFPSFLQHLIDQLCEDVKTVRPAVEKTRQNQTKNPDVDRLEEDVNRLRKRWESCCMQVNHPNMKCHQFAFASLPPLLLGNQTNLECKSHGTKEWIC